MSAIRKYASRYRTLISIVGVLILAGIGFAALSHLLHATHIKDIRGAVAALPPNSIIAAMLLTAVSYLALTFYDVLALRIIGRPLPYHTAALASFTSYTLSHNLGLALLTGGSARYRVYSAAGLGMADVARVVALAGMTFWSGVLAVAGLTMSVHPMPLPIDGMTVGAPIMRAIGLLLVALITGLILWSGKSGRDQRFWNWTLPLPGTMPALAQLGVAAIDLAAASAALFVLVPEASAAAWPTFFIGYTLAIIVVLITHVPGGIGIFEAVMVAALPSVNRPELVAALLAYRVIYYLLPLVIAVLIVAYQEGRRWRGPLATTLRGAQTLASSIAPIMISAVVFLGGAILLVSGSLPAEKARMAILYDVLPTPFVETSHMAASLVGAALLILSNGLYRRLDGAFWLTRILLIAGAAFSLLKGLDYEEAIAMLVIAGILQWTKGAFYRRTQFVAEALSPGWLATVAVILGLSVWIGMFAYRHVAYQDDLWWRFAVNGDSSRFLRASFAAAVLLVGSGVYFLLRPVAARREVHALDQEPDLRALNYSQRTDANLAFVGDKRFLVSDSGDCFIMYQIHGHSWIVMGDPIGPRAEWGDLLWLLRERADAAQGRLLLYQISTFALPIAIELGLQIVKYGEEALVDLANFSLEGAEAKPLRYIERRSTREGAVFEIVPAENLPAIMDELAAISTTWMAAKGHREKGFSVGRFDPDYMAQFDCAIVRREQRIIAFANIWKTYDKSELSVDLMRHTDDMPYGTMDFLFIHLMLWGQAQGYRTFSLGLAPLSGLDARRLAPLWAKLGSLLYRHGESLYGFEGLRSYKDKFSPNWDPRFIAGPQGLSFGRALVDLQALISARVSSLSGPRLIPRVRDPVATEKTAGIIPIR